MVFIQRKPSSIKSLDIKSDHIAYPKDVWIEL